MNAYKYRMCIICCRFSLEPPNSGSGSTNRKQKTLKNLMDSNQSNYGEPVIIEEPETTDNPKNNFLSFSLCNGYAWKVSSFEIFLSL